MTQQQVEVLTLILQSVEMYAGKKVVKVKVAPAGDGVQHIVAVELVGEAA